MRPLPVRSFANVPAFVRGVSTIRGEPVPVVDLARLLGGPEATAGRFVVVRVDRRKVALAVQSVIGVKDLKPTQVRSVPPLLQAAHRELVSELGTTDEGLLVVLSSAWTLPEEAWAALEKDRG
jgi:purine-binding chemotaxis protein CheW